MPYNVPIEPTYHHAIAGAIGGCLTRFICQPLDVVKIRFQLQVEPITKHSQGKYKSMLQSFSLIAREEGLSALWKGHVPAQLLSIIFGTNQFYFYNIIAPQLHKVKYVGEMDNAVHFLSGSAAGCIATFLSFPMDTLRTRLIAQSSQNKAYTGVVHLCRVMIKTESVRGFYRGLSPTLLQIAPLVGLQFFTYEFVKDIKFLPANYEDENHHKQVGVVNSLVAGCLAGLVAKTIVYPLDLARKRLQIQGFEQGRGAGFGEHFKCGGLGHCLSLTVRKEGIRGLFKGLGPSQFKAALMTALHFTIYEQSLLFIRHFNESRN